MTEVDDLLNKLDKFNTLKRRVARSNNYCVFILIIESLIQKQGYFELQQIADKMNISYGYVFQLAKPFVLQGILSKHNQPGTAITYGIKNQLRFSKVVEIAKKILEEDKNG